MAKVLTTLLLGVLPFCTIGQAAADGRLIKPSNPQLHYGGRWVKPNSYQYRVGRGAAYIKANFTGDSIGARIIDKGQAIFWRVQIDNGEARRFRATANFTSLGTKLGQGPHSLLLERDTEGSAGLTEFLGLELAADGKILPGPKLLPRQLEFLGDSITAGAFALGPRRPTGNEFEDFMAVESSYLAFGPLLARKLGAEYSVIASSGEGVVHNSQEPELTVGNHAVDNYLRTYFSQKLPLWQETGPEPDAVILNHGTNDFIGTFKPTPAEFTAGYQHLLTVIRSKHPKSTIICLGVFPYDKYLLTEPLIAKAVQAVRAAGDKKVYQVSVNGTKPFLAASDFAGDAEHPLALGHEKLAEVLRPRIAKILHW